MAPSNKKVKTPRRTMMVRLVSILMVVLLILPMLLAAVLKGVFW